MNDLLRKPTLLPKHLEIVDRNQLLVSETNIDRWMRSRQTCMYCSAALLRHIRLGSLYWYCSYCHL